MTDEYLKGIEAKTQAMTDNANKVEKQPRYCSRCGAGEGEYWACEEPNCGTLMVAEQQETKATRLPDPVTEGEVKEAITWLENSCTIKGGMRRDDCYCSDRRAARLLQSLSDTVGRLKEERDTAARNVVEQADEILAAAREVESLESQLSAANAEIERLTQINSDKVNNWNFYLLRSSQLEDEVARLKADLAALNSKDTPKP